MVLATDIWTPNCLKNIGKFMKRRNLSFTETLIDSHSFLFFDHIEQQSYILILMAHDKVGVEVLKKYIEHCMNKQINHYIVIYQKSITSTCLKILNNFFEYNIELFPLDQFKFDITRIKYYTKHEKVSDNEKKRLKKIYQGSNLPVILASDPIVRYFGFKKDDILLIHRENNELYYRIVK